MKKTAIEFLAVVFTLLTVALLIAQPQCTPAQRQIVRSAVDVSIELCELTFGDKPELLPQKVSLEEFCHAAENYQPFLDQVLSAQKNGVQMRTRVLKDAGAD